MRFSILSAAYLRAMRLFSDTSALREEMFMRRAIESILIQGALMVTRLIASVILARLLGVAGYGSYSFIYAIIILINIIPASGLEYTVVRFASTYVAAGRLGLLRGIFSRAFLAAAAFGLAAAALVFAVSRTSIVAPIHAFSPSVLAAAAIPLLFLPLVAVTGGMIRSLHPGVIGQLPEYLVRPLIFLVFVACIFILGQQVQPSPALAMIGQGLAAICALGLALFWFFRYRPRYIWRVRLEYETKSWVKTMLPLAFMGGLTMINLQVDILLLGGMTTAHETGLYKVAVQGANIVALSAVGVNLLMAPRITSLYSQGQPERLQKLLNLSIHGAFVVALFVAIVFWFEGQTILVTIFGQGYRSSYPILAILCLSQIANTGMASAGLILNMTGHERDALLITVGAVCVNIALNVILIPYFSGIGAALATMIAMILWKSCLAYRAWWKTGLVSVVFLSLFSRRTVTT